MRTPLSPPLVACLASLLSLFILAGGVLQLDEMKARFLNEMTRLKSDTVAQAERAFHHWRELSHETREAEVKLQSVKRLVEVLGTHV